MKVTRNNDDARKTLCAIILIDDICEAITALGKSDLFMANSANKILKVCVEYYKEYREAPKTDFDEIYRAKYEQDENAIEYYEKILTSFNHIAERQTTNSSTKFFLDLAEKHFNEVVMARHRQELEDEQLSLSEYEEFMNDYERINLGTGKEGVRAFDVNVLRKDLEILTADPVVTFKDVGLNSFFQDKTFERGSFVAFLGRDKIGKSAWLVDIAYRGLLEKRNVLYFAAGDENQAKIMKRFTQRCIRKPLLACEYKIPRDIKKIDSDFPEVQLETIVQEEDIDWEEEFEERRKKLLTTGIDLHEQFIISTYDADTINAEGIKKITQSWGKKGWIADLIVIDYADLLAPPYGMMESRDQINKTWKQLRALATNYNCCVVTATQADAAAYTADLLGMENFSDNKRKLSHVTGMVGLNRTSRDDEDQITRLNWIVHRDLKYDITRPLYVAGCLEASSPAITATW